MICFKTAFPTEKLHSVIKYLKENSGHGYKICQREVYKFKTPHYKFLTLILPNKKVMAA